jgi:DUF1009 family protein
MTKSTTKTEARPLRLGQGDRVAVVAGSGRLPVSVASSLAASGHRPFVLLVTGEADALDDLKAFDHEEIGLGEFATLPARLRRHAVTHLVFSGGIGRRPSWREIRINATLLRFIVRTVRALRQGDDGLLGALVRAMEQEGIKVVGAHEVAPDLLAAQGVLTKAQPTAADRRDLDAAGRAARAIGALDIGQGAIAIGGRAVALEGIEGTDGLLARTKDMRGHGRLAGKKRGVLVKCAKPQQELRVDLPTIGPLTVEAAHAAGLAGIGIEAGRALILDYETMVARADALGLFVVGLTARELP